MALLDKDYALGKCRIVDVESLGYLALLIFENCPLAKIGIDITELKQGCSIEKCPHRPRRGRTIGWDCPFWTGLKQENYGGKRR